MKSILHLLADIVLLPVTGCIFPGNRDFSDDHDRLNILKHKKQPSGSPPAEQATPMTGASLPCRNSALSIGGKIHQI
jgi:hypothetical protein